MNFIIDVITLELSKELRKGNIDMKQLILNIDRDILKEFMNAMIIIIIIINRLIHSIEFRNGLIINFRY